MRATLPAFPILIFAFISVLISLATPASARAGDVTANTPADTVVGIPAENPDVTSGERWTNFGAMYVAQWVYYLVAQHETILNNGSFEHWSTQFYRAHFDSDSFDYNISKHSFVGQAYFQFYRSRGYTTKDSFFWAFASSLAFEMTIESFTERPSIQDIYQTPVYGTILGIGLESLSRVCHRTGTTLGHVCGYIFDPFTLIPATAKFALVPEVSRDRYVANLRWEF